MTSKLMLCTLVAAGVTLGRGTPAAAVTIALDAPSSPKEASRVEASVSLFRVGESRDTEQLVTIPVGSARAVDLTSGEWRFHVRASGYFAPVQSFAVHGPSDVVRIRLWPTGKIHGVFEVPKGSRAPEILQVRWKAAETRQPQGELPPESLETCDVHGRKWMCDVPAALMDVRLRAPHFITQFRWGLHVSAGKDLDVGRLALLPGASVVGFVMPGDGVKLDREQIRVTLTPVSRGQDSATSSLALTARVQNAKGFFEIGGVAQGEYLISAMQPGAASKRLRIGVRPDSETEIREPVLVELPRSMRAQLTPPRDPDGQPWRVYLTTVVRAEWSDLPAQSFADKDGAVEWKRILPGNYRLAVGPASGGVFLRRDIEIDHESPTFDLQVPETVVKGSVRLGSDPLEADVIVGGRFGPQRVTLHSDATGNFSGTVPFKPEESWTIDVESTAPTVRHTFQQTPSKGEGTDDLTLELDIPRNAIAGIVVDENDRPLAKSLVNIGPEDSTQPLIQTHVESDGRFQLSGLTPGNYKIEALSFDKRASGLKSITVAEGSELPDIKLVVRALGELKGRILSGSGPVPSAYLAVFPTDREMSLNVPVTTSADGSFSYQLPAGTTEADIVLSAPGFPIKMLHVRVEPDPLTILVDQNGGAIELDIPQYKEGSPVQVLEHRGVAKAVWFFVGTFGVPVAASAHAGRTRVSLPSMEAGDYRLCTIQSGEPLSSVFSQQQHCVAGTLAPYGRLALAAN